MTATAPVDKAAPMWTLSADELRVVARITATVLPSMLRIDLGDDDVILAETVAARSLLAHGLAMPTDGHGIGLAPGAADQLAPLLAPVAVVEVELDAGQPSRHVMVAAHDGAVLALHERELGVWRIDRISGALGAAVWDVVEWPGEPASSASGAQFVLPVSAGLEVDRLARAGLWPEVDRALAEAGVDETTARKWRAAHQQRRLVGRVRLARTIGPEIYEAGEVRWLDGGAAGVWLLSEIDEVTAVIEDVGAQAVWVALDALIGKD